MRQKPVTIEVRKTVSIGPFLLRNNSSPLRLREGRTDLEAVLRGCLRYTSRKLFRQAISDAMKGPKPVNHERHKPKREANQPKPRSEPWAKEALKKEKVAGTNPSSTPLPFSTPIVVRTG